MAIEIVDLPIENGGSFHSYVNVYLRVVEYTSKEYDHWVCPEMGECPTGCFDREQDDTVNLGFWGTALCFSTKILTRALVFQGDF